MSDKVVPIESRLTDIFGFSSYLQSSLESGLKELIRSQRISDRLLKAVEYSVFSGGKRIRPLCTASLVADCKGKIEDALPACMSLELLHCASLVHDDLPALDNDDFRRGKPTCHKVYGEPTAVLAGDLMVALATKAIVDSSLEDSTKSLLAATHSSAFISLCNGQDLDLVGASSESELIELHSEKTGALFSAAVKSAGVILGLDDGFLASSVELGQAMGVYFQLVDDALDVFGSDMQRGRVGSSDARNSKMTLFNSGSIDDAVRVVNVHRKRVFSALAGLEQACGHSLKLFRGIVKSIDQRLEECLPQLFDTAI